MRDERLIRRFTVQPLHFARYASNATYSSTHARAHAQSAHTHTNNTHRTQGTHTELKNIDSTHADLLFGEQVVHGRHDRFDHLPAAGPRRLYQHARFVRVIASADRVRSGMLDK